MLVQWKEARMLGVAATADTTLAIMPGFNEFPDELWNQARPSLLGKIKDKTIVEFGAEISEEVLKIKGKDTTVVTAKGKEFADLTANEQEAVIGETYNVKQLQAWKLVCDDSVRNAISQRIEDMKSRPAPKN